MHRLRSTAAHVLPWWRVDRGQTCTHPLPRSPSTGLEVRRAVGPRRPEPLSEGCGSWPVSAFQPHPSHSPCGAPGTACSYHSSWPRRRAATSAPDTQSRRHRVSHVRRRTRRHALGGRIFSHLQQKQTCVGGGREKTALKVRGPGSVMTENELVVHRSHRTSPCLDTGLMNWAAHPWAFDYIRYHMRTLRWSVGVEYRCRSRASAFHATLTWSTKVCETFCGKNPSLGPGTKDVLCIWCEVCAVKSHGDRKAYYKVACDVLVRINSQRINGSAVRRPPN